MDGTIPLARKPKDTVRMLRGRFETLKVPVAFLVGVAADVATALQRMHELRISHGDVYAHNVLVNRDMKSPLLSASEAAAGPLTGAPGIAAAAAALPSPSFAVLFDYGASFFYSTDGAAFNFFEAVEVRAFGLLLRDMVHFLIPIDDQEKEGKKKGEKEEKEEAASSSGGGSGGSGGGRWAAHVKLLEDVATSCADAAPAHRPSFAQIVEVLRQAQSRAAGGAGGSMPLPLLPWPMDSSLDG